MTNHRWKENFETAWQNHPSCTREFFKISSGILSRPDRKHYMGKYIHVLQDQKNATKNTLSGKTVFHECRNEDIPK